MTEVYIHGVLAKKYGKVHKFALKKPRDVLSAMEANHENFLQDLKQLLRNNIYYSFVVDRKVVRQASELSSCKQASRIDLIPIINGGGLEPATIALIIAVISTIGSAVYQYVQAGKMEFPELPGASSATSANSRSLSFSNRENITEQGNPVPLVYGRMKVGSAVIQSTVKSFPLSITLDQEFKNTSSKNSGNQNATISNSIIDTDTADSQG